MALVEKRFSAMYAALFAIFILFGTSMTIIGATLPKILADFGWSYATAGMVIAAGAIGYFMATYAAGFLVSAIGPRSTMIAGLVLLIAGLFFFASVPSAFINLLLYLGIGIGQGFIEITVNWSTLRMETSGKGRAMNLMHGAFAVGAFAGPFIIGILMGADLSWTLVYRGIALVFIVPLALTLLMPFSALGRDAGHHNSGSRRALYSHPAYWLGFSALLFYFGVELGVSNWIAEYFVTVFKSSPAAGSFMVSLFWGGLLLGRFAVPLVYHGERRDVVLLSMSVLMSFSIIALSAIGFINTGLTARIAASCFAALAGLGCSIVYPMVVTMVGSIFPHAQGEAVAFSSTGGGIGAFIFPFFMSTIANAWGLRLGFASYAVFSVVVVFLAYRLVELSRDRERVRESDAATGA
jgi:fucose permease